MKLITIKNISKFMDFVFVSNNPVTDEVVKNYLESKDKSMGLVIYPAGLFSNQLNHYIDYSVNFVEEL